MKFDTLLGFVRKGRVKARSIVRGPTTHQLWRFACQVKGLSREFELCYSCGGTIRRDAHVCPQCNRPQGPPGDPDVFIEGAQQGAMQPATVQPAMMPAPAPAAPVAPAFIPPPAVNVAPPRAESGRPPVYRELNSQSVAVDQDLVVPPLAPAACGAAEAPVAQAAAPVPPPAQQPPPQPAPSAPAAPSRGPTDPAGPPGAAQGRRRAEDVFLSAKDLAAAFQLDFKPDPKSGDAEAEYFRSGAAARATKESDTALPWPPRRRRKRRVGRFVVLLLFVSVGGFGAYLAVDGQFRRQAWDWVNAKYLSLTGADLYPDIATRPRAGTTTAPAQGRSAAATTAVTTVPTANRAAPAATQPVSPPPQSPRPSPQSATAGSRAVAPLPDRVRAAAAPPERATPPAATRPLVVAPPRQPATSPVVAATQPARTSPPIPTQAQAPARPRLTLEDAQKRATALYRKAFDAEAQDPPDYAAAKRLYKQIMDDLPEEIEGQGVWPGDVKLRYEQTRKMLGEN
jgi:hypothetical protein